jgi:hypothetical protein
MCPAAFVLAGWRLSLVQTVCRQVDRSVGEIDVGPRQHNHSFLEISSRLLTQDVRNGASPLGRKEGPVFLWRRYVCLA